MKKIIKLIIGIFILLLIFELIAYLLKDEHKVTYNIKDNNKTFQITEIYKNKKYYIKITTENLKYSLEIDDDFHKREEIINKIYSFQTKDIYCIYPAIKKSNNSNILCSKNGKSYAYTHYEKDLIQFIKILKNNGYNSPSWKKKSNSSKKIETLTAYQNNLQDNTYIYIYKYNGFFSINKKKPRTNKSISKRHLH